MPTPEQSIERVRFLLGASLEGVSTVINSRNANAIKSIGQKAERYFKDGILREQERGERRHRRETGNFTFGRNGAFKGFFTSRGQGKGTRSGWGYPDIQRADQETNYVWRSLEFGLGARGEKGQLFGPRGEAKLPTFYTFVPFGNTATGVFQPRSKKTSTSGMLIPPNVSPRSVRSAGKARRKRHRGIEPKRFIRRAGEEVMQGLDKKYVRDVTTVYVKRFK